MAGSNKKNTWFNSGHRELVQLLKQENFSKSIEIVSNMGPSSREQALVEIAYQFSMTDSAFQQLIVYLESGTIPKYDPDLFTPVTVIKPKDENVIYLALHRDISSSDMEIFIRDHWPRKVMPHLKEAQQHHEQEGRVYQLRHQVQLLRGQGLSVTKIANEVELSQDRVRQLLKQPPISPKLPMAFYRLTKIKFRKKINDTK